jgi:phenylalanyl-tRNA synthetase beta chain
VNIFEVAKVFSGDKNASPKEELALGIALCGEKVTLLSKGLIREEMGLLHLKGIVEILLGRLGIQGYDFQIDNRGVSIEKNDISLGFLAQLPKQALNSLDIKNKEVFVAEIYLGKVFSTANLTKKFSALPMYPGISRDISLLLKEEIKIADIAQLIRENGRPFLREVRVVDFYKGKQIPAGHKGLTICCFYRSDERTLTEEEINPLHAAVLAGLQEKFNVQVR